MSGELGYGFAIRPLAGSLTPLLGYDYRGPGATRGRVGVAYALGDNPQGDFRLRLDATRTERPETAPDHSLEASVELRY